MKDIEDMQEACELAIEHYKRMIEWVETQNYDDVVNLKAMQNAIGEDWYADHCPLCTFVDGDCNKCILDPRCDYWKSAWQQMCDADNWGMWIDRANDVKREIANWLRNHPRS